MREHPVPQQISSYEFRLVGDMTIKQFFQVAGGIVVALIFYSLPFPAFIKWPFVVLAAAFGGALAFLPINERPLSDWVFAYLKAIYSPTYYEWAQNGAEDVFKVGGDEPLIIPTQGESAAQKYLNSTPQTDANPELEAAEQNYLNRIKGMFANQQTPSVVSKPTELIPNISTQATIIQSNAQQPATPDSSASIGVREVKVVPTDAVRIATDTTTTQTQNSTTNFTSMRTEPFTPQAVTPVFATETSPDKSVAVNATFIPDATPPTPPTIPNTIVGQVLEATGRIVDGAIMEIKDEAGRPVRAIRSNRVGHFITVTPLKNGEYEIETEKEGLLFDVVKFKAEGNIIPSIQIKSRG